MKEKFYHITFLIIIFLESLMTESTRRQERNQYHIDHFYFADDPNTITYLKKDGFIKETINENNQTNTMQNPIDFNFYNSSSNSPSSLNDIMILNQFLSTESDDQDFNLYNDYSEY